MKKLTQNDVERLNEFLQLPSVYKSCFTFEPEEEKLWDNPGKALLNDNDTICLQPDNESLCILHRYGAQKNTTMVLDIGASKQGRMHTIEALEKCFDWIFEHNTTETVITYVTLGQQEEERIIVESGMIPIDMKSNSGGKNKKIFLYNRELWELRNQGHTEQDERFQRATAHLEHNFRQLIKSMKIITTG